MRAMKDSGVEWIGDIPREWETRQIKYALENHSGGAWGANKGESERDCICVRVADFDYSHLSVNYSEVMTVRSYQQKTICDSALKSGDILLEKSGGGEITPVGRSVLFSSEREMMCANFIEWLRPNFSIQPQFLNYWLSAAYSNGYSKRNVKQTTGIQNLDIPAFLSEKVLVPSGEEQQRISHYLDTKCAEIDALIAAKEKTNALLKERRQSIIYEAVTKGLDPTVPMKDSGIEWIGEIPKGWSTRKAKHIGFFKSGDGITAENISVYDEYPVYGGNGIRGYTDQYTHKGAYVLIGRQGALCGNVHLARGAFWASEHAVVGDIISDYDVRLAYYIFSAINLNRLSVTAAQPGLSVDQIVNVIMPSPSSIEEQRKICDYLDSACKETDSAIVLNEQTIQQLKEYRQSLIYEAVTGKIEV